MALKNDSPSASGEISTNQDLQDAEEYEIKFVHDVYQQIAGHFSETRYKVRIPTLYTCVVKKEFTDQCSRGRLSNDSCSNRNRDLLGLISDAAMGNISRSIRIYS